MHYAYAVTRPESLPAVFEGGQKLTDAITGYLVWLQTLGEVEEPRGIVFHDFDSATTIFSTHVLPAWTDHELIHIDPLVDDWRHIYLSALTEGLSPSIQTLIRSYYDSLNYSDVATIVAHELTHHLRVFAEVPEDATWFEEGFCFYAPRKQLLPADRLRELQSVEKALIDAHGERLGGHPIWQFGRSDTGGGFTDALFDYWRAIHAVSTLIDTYAHGDSKSILALFSRWKNQSDRATRLDEFLIAALEVSEMDQRQVWLLSGIA